MSAPQPKDTLPEPLRDALSDLFRKGTAPNTLRAYEQDLRYIQAWKAARFGVDLTWPETETTALAFLLDHTGPAEGIARDVAQTLVLQGVRRSLDPPAPTTTNRRIASWGALHRMRNLTSPFASPLVRAARAKAGRVSDRRPQAKSAHPITRAVLEDLLSVPDPTLRGLRDRAVLITAWASGGRRRSEIAGLRIEDLTLSDTDDRLWIQLLGTKTTRKASTPKLPLKGRAARVLRAWIEAAEITQGPLFRAMTKSDRVLDRGLSPDGIRLLLQRCLVAAGYAKDFASPHGLRAGFLTQAALDGVPLQAAMQLSLHTSPLQAQAYYQDVDIEQNPATDLLD